MKLCWKSVQKLIKILWKSEKRGIFFAGFIDILDRDRAGKLIVGERNAVYVVNIASRACNRTLFFDF